MLSIIEGRVLGCLLEKERTVPDQYPLTMNVLIAACNQSSARVPVMHLDVNEVEAAVGNMKVDGWVRIVHPSHGRSVTRYRHVADEKLHLDEPALALVATLLVRGPQTSAELRSHCERMHQFASPTAVEAELSGVVDAGLVQRIERQPGQKEQRWRQLLAEEAELDSVDALAPAAMAGSMAERLAHLEARVAQLERLLADLL